MRNTVKFTVLAATILASGPAMVTSALAQTTAPATAPATTEAPATMDTPATTAPATMDAPAAPAAVEGLPEGYVHVESAQVTGDQMKGLDVYDLAGDKIADVEDIVIGADSKVTGVLVDVGGFLGLGAHKVELKPEELQVYKDAEGTDMRAYTALSKDALKALPEYTGAN